MNLRRKKRGKTRHGAAIEAPSEYGFVTSDSPTPAPVVERTQQTEENERESPFVLLVSALKLVLGLGVVLSLSIAMAWGAHRYALTTPRFAIARFDVTGNRHYNADQLGRLAGVSRGQNLFSVDTRAAEERLLGDPWIKQAKVGRTLPGTLRIEVVERDVAAVAALDDGLYLVTPEGEPFKPVDAKDPTDLPFLTGVSARDLATDRARAIDRLALGLEVVREYDGLSLSRTFEAEEVHLEPDGAVVLTIGKRGTTLELGTGPFRQKLLMAARVIGKLQAGGELPGIVFLNNDAHPERVVVRMR